MQYAYFNWKRGSKISLRDKVRIIGVNYLYFQTPNSERLGVEFVSAGTPGGNFPTMLMFVINNKHNKSRVQTLLVTVVLLFNLTVVLLFNLTVVLLLVVHLSSHNLLSPNSDIQTICTNFICTEQGSIKVKLSNIQGDFV